MKGETAANNATEPRADVIKLEHADYLEFENAYLKARVAADGLRAAQAMADQVRRRLIQKYGILGEWHVDPATETLRRVASRAETSGVDEALTGDVTSQA